MVAIFGDTDAAHQFHHEVGPPRTGASGIENFRDVTVSEAELRELFSRAGVTAVELRLDPTSGQSRGQAFVAMVIPELAAPAPSIFHGYGVGDAILP